MKKFRKLLSLVLAMVMVLAMAAPSWAADDGKITITDARVGASYNIYRLFDLKISTAAEGETPSYAYTINSDWETFFKGAGAQYITVDSAGNVTGLAGIDENSSDAEKTAAAKRLADAAIAYSAKPAAIATDIAESTTVEFIGLVYGYYLVDSGAGTLCMLNSTSPDVVIDEKNEEPTVDKERVDDEGKTESDTSVSIGDTVNYKVTITAQPGAKNYVLTDTMDDGLSFDSESVKVTVGGNELTSKAENSVNYDYEVAVGGQNDNYTFKVIFTDTYCTSIKEETSIVIIYNATVNEKAITGETDPLTNSAKLSYGDSSTIDTVPASVELHTYGFGLVKTDGTNKVLANAKFKLYDAETGGNEIKLVSTGTDSYRVAKKDEKEEDIVDKIVAGNLTIDGLGNGTYYLEETDAPEGYNKLTERKGITISNSDQFAKVNEEGTAYVSGGLQVINNAGSTLPSTGGIGTTVFYAAGIILMAGAVFFVVRRKRA